MCRRDSTVAVLAGTIVVAYLSLVLGELAPKRLALQRAEGVSLFAAPTMLSRLVNHPLAGSVDTRPLKTISYGGAPMYVADLKRALELLGPKLCQLYGQGESPMTITGLSKLMHAEREHPRFEARQGCAQAIVDAQAKAEMVIIGACEVDGVGVVKDVCIVVRRGQHKADGVAAANRLTVHGDVLGREAHGGPLDRAATTSQGSIDHASRVGG